MVKHGPRSHCTWLNLCSSHFFSCKASSIFCNLTQDLMGSAPGSAHARPSAQPPIDTSGNFSPQVSGKGGRVHKLTNFLVISGDSKHFSFFPKKPKKSTPGVQGGGPPILFQPQILFFCDLKSHAKFWNPTITPSGRKVTTSERRRRKRKKRR